jgi:hypothetical protein
MSVSLAGGVNSRADSVVKFDSCEFVIEERDVGYVRVVEDNGSREISAVSLFKTGWRLS